MRKKLVAGNWKMNLTQHEALELVNDVVNNVYDNADDKLVIISPSFLYLKEAVEITSSYKNIAVAAQNCATKISGAFTGEISVVMLQSIGIEYVIIGHSERRQFFGDTNETVKQKIDLCLAYNLTPIFCIGEMLEERNGDNHFTVVENQIGESTKHLGANDYLKLIIAYEPVWAIGTGLTASPQQAQEMHAHIRNCIAKITNENVAKNISILYGGSCNENNAKELFACADIDGGLIGGASLKADSFAKIVESL